MKTGTQHAEGGSRCPNCDSININTIDSIEADGAEAWEHVECHDCGGIWTDMYLLVGYTNFERNPK